MFVCLCGFCVVFVLVSVCAANVLREGDRVCIGIGGVHTLEGVFLILRCFWRKKGYVVKWAPDERGETKICFCECSFL